jgi:hypothetical protein
MNHYYNFKFYKLYKTGFVKKKKKNFMFLIWKNISKLGYLCINHYYNFKFLWIPVISQKDLGFIQIN